MPSPRDQDQDVDDDHVTKLADLNTQPDENDEDHAPGEDEDDDEIIDSEGDDDTDFPGKPRTPGLPDETISERD